MSFVVKTEKLTPPAWFAGMVDGNIGQLVCIARNPFDAWQFRTEREAKRCRKELGADWIITELSGFGMSDNLKAFV